MSATIRRMTPPALVPGGRLVIDGDGFHVEPGRIPTVTIGGETARVERASPRSLVVRVPDGLSGGLQPVAVEGVDGATAFVTVGALVTTGLHQVDSPAFDRQGRLYATVSGGRGQETPVSVFRIDRDGSREAFVANLPSATSLAFDAHDVLHVSSRFDGRVYTVAADGTYTPRADGLGTAFGLAFDADGCLYVGDRSGTIFTLAPGEDVPTTYATVPASIAAFHLAMAPDGVLYVTAPTLNSCDAIHRIARDGVPERWVERFGRPQGLAFDRDGRLHVVDALAGDSGLYRMTADGHRDLVVSGPGLIGVAFDPLGGFVVCSTEAIYRFP